MWKTPSHCHEEVLRKLKKSNRRQTAKHLARGLERNERIEPTDSHLYSLALDVYTRVNCRTRRYTVARRKRGGPSKRWCRDKHIWALMDHMAKGHGKVLREQSALAPSPTSFIQPFSVASGWVWQKYALPARALQEPLQESKGNLLLVLLAASSTGLVLGRTPEQAGQVLSRVFNRRKV